MVRSLFIGLALLLGIGNATADTVYGKQKVVYHLNSDEDRALNMALINMQNHIAAVGQDKIKLVMVMHGSGVGLLQKANTDPALQTRIIDLKRQGVALRVCENTLKNKKLDYRRDLFDVARQDLVPSGVAELARLQQQGYLYVKP